MINETKLYKASRMMEALNNEKGFKIAKILTNTKKTFKEISGCLEGTIMFQLTNLIDSGVVIKEVAPDKTVLYYTNLDKLSIIKKAIKKFI
tara:strand:- start:165 stop:437 length:273 start_codon:yes stop_codon:yes gene_type:complete